jgi:cyclase
MLKTRLIPVLYLMNGLIVRSEQFSVHQIIGNIVNQAARYNEWDVDELIYIDISREGGADLRRDDHKVESYSEPREVIERIASVCFMPLTVGGGIRCMEDAEMRIRHGADKLTLNTALFDAPDLVGALARRYGSQAVVASIDYRVVDGKPRVHSSFGRRDAGVDPCDWARHCVGLGAGEILLNAVDRDGMACGYDLDTIARVVRSVRVPVVACGGAAEFNDFVQVVRETGVSAAAAGNIFHFTERSYPRAKQLMRKEGLDVRA